jgi:hypothetical protein
MGGISSFPRNNPYKMDKLLQVLICIGNNGFLQQCIQFKVVSNFFSKNHDLENILHYDKNYASVQKLYKSVVDKKVIHPLESMTLSLYHGMMTRNIDNSKIGFSLEKIITKQTPNCGNLIFHLIKNSSLTMTDKMKNSILLIGLKEMRLSLLSLAIEMGANPNIKFRDTSIIVYFWKNNFPKIVDVLVRFNANLIPLMTHAIKSNNFELAYQCIEWGVNLNSFTEEGYSLLHYVYMFSQIGTDINWFEMLISHGIDIDIVSPFFESTLLATVSSNGGIVLIEYLLEKEADIEKSDPLNYVILMKNKMEKKVFFEIIKIFIRKGANVKKKYTNNKTDLMYLCDSPGNEELIDLFLENGANINAITNDGYFPLSIALQTNNFNIFKQLLNKPGINLNIHNNLGMNILTIACACKKESFAVELLRFDVDVNNNSFNEGSSLIFAIKNSFSIDFVKTLVRKGVDVNKRCVVNGIYDMTAFGYCVLIHNNKNESIRNRNLAGTIGQFLLDECNANKIRPYESISWFPK